MEHTTQDTGRLTADFGALLMARAGRHMLELSGTALLETVRREGAVLLRGFAGSLEDFEAFTQTVAVRFIHNGNDEREALGDQGRTRSVTPGKNYVGPHSEFSYTPFRPDLLFFYCIHPAASGGASLLWDGRRIWRDMPGNIKELFLKKRILFRYRNVGAEFFGQFTGTTSPDEVERFLAGVDNLYCKRTEQGFDIDYAAAACVNEPGTPHLSFSNSIAVLPGTEFDDGTMLDAATRGELLALALKQTVRIETLPGDVLVLDNWRTMHGREAFDDPARRMCIRMGYAGVGAHAQAAQEIEEVEY